MNDLGEACVVQAVEEVCGIQVNGVINVEMEIAEEHVVFDVIGEGGDEVSYEVNKVGSQPWWSVHEGSLDGCPFICLSLKFMCSMAGAA